VPLLGGIAVLVTLMGMVLVHGALAHFIRMQPSLLEFVSRDFHRHLPVFQSAGGYRLIVILGGGVLMALVGLWDDIHGLSIRKRLYLEFAIALFVVLMGVRPGLAFLPPWLAVIVAVIWLVGITNSFNLIDGADGLASGIGGLCAVNLGMAMILGNHPATAVLLFCLAGACLGFLRHNWHPARLFLGSSGSLFIGYMLGATTLVATYMSPHAAGLYPLLIPVLVFTVPLYDTASVIVIRLFKRRSIFEGDRSHLHHRLMKMGFSHRQTVAFMYIMCLAFGVGSILLTRTDAVGSLVILAQVGILLGLIALLEWVSARTRPGTARIGSAVVPAPGVETEKPAEPARVT
jgi:UDP-GlcNAc:undecaprenyl-phosphate GlcNAc-1-phosphate transferase